MTYITGPANTDLLDRLTAETAVLDAQLAADARKGPRQCCSDYSSVLFCQDGEDIWECPVCRAVWRAPCR